MKPPLPFLVEVESCSNCKHLRGVGNLIYVWYPRCMLREFDYYKVGVEAYYKCEKWEVKQKKVRRKTAGEEKE